MEYFLTKTTDNAEVAAERIAKATPIMPFHVHEAIIKIIRQTWIAWFSGIVIGKLLFVTANYISVMTRVKAISLLSGGLDSILATELIRRQGIEVITFNVKTPFGIPKKDGSSEATQAADQLKVPLKVLCVEQDYLRMLRKPKHGYGKNLNPCVDCKIFILKKAKKYAKEIGADFIFTGEVLGERPMSQHGPALKIIAEESGLKGKLLRPLSAKLLSETVAEKKGLVDRNKLLSIQGRSRKPQFELAKEFGITIFPSPAGGCLLNLRRILKKTARSLRKQETHLHGGYCFAAGWQAL